MTLVLANKVKASSIKKFKLSINNKN